MDEPTQPDPPPSHPTSPTPAAASSTPSRQTEEPGPRENAAGDEPFDPLAPPPGPALPRQHAAGLETDAADLSSPSIAPDHDPHREALLAALYEDHDSELEAEDPTEQAEPAESPTAEPAGTTAPAPAKPVDPWAHRRGEPRIFAFFWSLYVLAAVAGSILWLTRLPVISATTYSPAARTLLVVIAAGICVLWPMTRLSQAAPEKRPLRAMLADLFVVLAPVQMVVWPMVVLAGWPIDIVAAVAAMLAAWAALAGGILAFTFAGRRSPGPVARMVAMMTCIAAAMGAPAVLALEPLRGARSLAWLHVCSPFTGVFAVTGSGWTGPTTGLRSWHWAGILLVLAAALACWAAALARAGTGSRGAERLH